MRPLPSLCLGLLATLTVGGALRAQEADPGPRFGVHLLLARPQMDFRTATTRNGWGVGLFAENPFTAHTVLQTRLDFIQFPEVRAFPRGTPPYAPTGLRSLDARSIALGLDLRYALPYDWLNRVYLLAGVSAARYEFRFYAPDPAPADTAIPEILRSKEITSIKLGGALGAGVTLSPRWTLAARYTYLRMDTFNLAALEASLGFRF